MFVGLAGETCTAKPPLTHTKYHLGHTVQFQQVFVGLAGETRPSLQTLFNPSQTLSHPRTRSTGVRRFHGSNLLPLTKLRLTHANPSPTINISSGVRRFGGRNLHHQTPSNPHQTPSHTPSHFRQVFVGFMGPTCPSLQTPLSPHQPPSHPPKFRQVFVGLAGETCSLLPNPI